MENLPDAPWIRDAELNGYPADDPVKCPICGEECDTIYMDEGNEVFGCNRCVHTVDAWYWKESQDRGDDW